jgi:hypothetical protein
MPFLTQQQFDEIVDPLGPQLCPTEPVFEQAEADAAHLAARLSGLAVPAEPSAETAHLRRPVAHLILAARAGTLQGWSDEQLRWARGREQQARADLEAEMTRGTAAAASAEGPAPADRIGEVEGLPVW